MRTSKSRRIATHDVTIFKDGRSHTTSPSRVYKSYPFLSRNWEKKYPKTKEVYFLRIKGQCLTLKWHTIN